MEVTEDMFCRVADDEEDCRVTEELEDILDNVDADDDADGGADDTSDVNADGCSDKEFDLCDLKNVRKKILKKYVYS